MLNTTYELNGTTLTVKPVGQLDSMTAPVFEEEISQRLSGVRSVIVDFEELNYISSAGLRVLLTLNRTLGETDAEMKLIHVNGVIMEIFEMTGLVDMIKVE
ncbi:MAG: STAS domain-containing protein [Lachnospiraceae bacterium]|nr:STAS domain-containing protein [Lachnospiraceae bacterium]